MEIDLQKQAARVIETGPEGGEGWVGRVLGKGKVVESEQGAGGEFGEEGGVDGAVVGRAVEFGFCVGFSVLSFFPLLEALVGEVGFNG